jgi:dipeptidyl aminopeptidase/acylaminoacyl peptidase
LDSQSARDIWILAMAGDRKPFSFLSTPASKTGARFSPDGKWIAYTSDEGRAVGGATSQIYVQPFAPESLNSRKVQISINGGIAPRWSDDGKELFYFGGRKLMVCEIRTSGNNLEPGIPKELFEAPPGRTPLTNFALSADGQRVLLPVLVEAESAMPISLLLNWTARLGNDSRNRSDNAN